MYTRSDSVTMSVPTNYPQTFAFPRAMATRSTQPEIFTFERIPTQATAVRSYAPLRPRKRCTRVMYPAKVRMHLPPAEKSPAKRWLLALCLVVLWQIYTEEPCADADKPQGSTATPPGADFQKVPLRSAEDRASNVAGFPSLRLPACERRGAPWLRVLANTSSAAAVIDVVETQSAVRAYDQSTGKGYMVALLVYHKLGSDK
ncbi:unnamed protein product [Merluccius merluccius]